MSDPGNVMGKWNYGMTPRFAYGEDTTYRKAMAFLDGPWVIEDWGCGTAYARNFVEKGRYLGLDGSWSMHCDQVVDLRSYHSLADAILMRHILEHNHDWRKILGNALLSFQKKFALVMFTPFAEVTKQIGSNFDGAVPDIAFRKQDLLDMIGSLPYTEEAVASATQYGVEHIFYITRSPEPPRPKPSVSIIIPTYQHLEDLLKPNLESLRQFTDLDRVEVIVVANGCTDGTEDYVKSLGQPFKVLSFPDALGYTRATNEGIKAATGDYLVLLNNDIVFLGQPKNQWLVQLLQPFQNDPKMGITGPLQLHDYYADQDIIVGSCLCVSRAALEAAGGVLDEIYSPGGGEDVDLCCKVRDAGFVVRQIPKEGKPNTQWANIDSTFMIWHKNNQTFKDMPDYWSKIVRRNGLVNVKRHNRNIRLNLFGKALWGYVSADDPTDLLASVPLDQTKLALEDGSVAEILAIQPFIRLSDRGIHRHAEGLVREWHRVLKPGGKLIIETIDYRTDEIEARESMQFTLTSVGFTSIVFLNAIYPGPHNRDFRVEAIKP